MLPGLREKRDSMCLVGGSRESVPNLLVLYASGMTVAKIYRAYEHSLALCVIPLAPHSHECTSPFSVYSDRTEAS